MAHTHNKEVTAAQSPDDDVHNLDHAAKLTDPAVLAVVHSKQPAASEAFLKDDNAAHKEHGQSKASPPIVRVIHTMTELSILYSA